ncbi:hypothetical protein FOCC_FOCC017197 [Frankliniella occidentalis]|uniref:Uncharacterized protein LOC113212439 n=1 Tax=Frankliniella occidentalis TaxID=133901 RepID=A0A6J1T5K9_FRAOC|nr:uncharacterized protein LOC113212439 [Frankliniella occidentalis]KAE8737340.1 hypothetical protein FOCC_FOCC017197 [Frankliniella occidentalis]
MKICTRNPAVALLVVVLALAVTARPAVLGPRASDRLLQEVLHRRAGETTDSADATASAPQSGQGPSPPSPATRTPTWDPQTLPPTRAAPTSAGPTRAGPTWAVPTWGLRPDGGPGSGGGSSRWDWDDDNDNSWDMGDRAFIAVVAVLVGMLLMGVPAYLACVRAAEASGMQVQSQPRPVAVSTASSLSHTVPADRTRPSSPARVHSTTRSPVSLMNSSAAA